jgi:hypothetical protein
MAFPDTSSKKNKGENQFNQGQKLKSDALIAEPANFSFGSHCSCDICERAGIVA